MCHLSSIFSYFLADKYFPPQNQMVYSTPDFEPRATLSKNMDTNDGTLKTFQTFLFRAQHILPPQVGSVLVTHPTP